MENLLSYSDCPDSVKNKLRSIWDRELENSFYLMGFKDGPADWQYEDNRDLKSRTSVIIKSDPNLYYYAEPKLI